ncbi:MAG: hypothetical protein ABIP20_06795 [Chthoniobacteraceae bacterium]
MSTWICSHCKKEAPESRTFCPACGNPNRELLAKRSSETTRTTNENALTQGTSAPTNVKVLLALSRLLISFGLVILVFCFVWPFLIYYLFFDESFDRTAAWFLKGGIGSYYFFYAAMDSAFSRDKLRWTLPLLAVLFAFAGIFVCTAFIMSLPSSLQLAQISFQARTLGILSALLGAVLTWLSISILRAALFYRRTLFGSNRLPHVQLVKLAKSPPNNT